MSVGHSKTCKNPLEKNGSEREPFGFPYLRPGVRKPKPAARITAILLLIVVPAVFAAAEQAAAAQAAGEESAGKRGSATGEEESFPAGPKILFGIDIAAGLKVDNQRGAEHRFENLSFYLDLDFNERSRAFAKIDIGDFLGYNALNRFGAEGWISGSPVYQDTEIFLESYVLGPGSPGSVLDLKLRLGYGSGQELLKMDFTGYQFERTVSSGINGLDLSAVLEIGTSFALTAAFNPASLDSSAAPYPDVFGAFSMQNDHRGSSWGSLIRFYSSSMQLFYDSSSNPGSSGYYELSHYSEAYTLGIGGNLYLDFAGIEIVGFGMTEFFISYNKSSPNIVQAEWGAGFQFPVFRSLEINLSGSNAVILSESGDGSFMNFGLDACAMFSDIFGVFAATAAVGILDDTGVLAEGGLRFRISEFVFDTGYAHHGVKSDSRFVRGAFDRTVSKDYSASGSGFFFSYSASF